MALLSSSMCLLSFWIQVIYVTGRWIWSLQQSLRICLLLSFCQVLLHVVRYIHNWYFYVFLGNIFTHHSIMSLFSSGTLSCPTLCDPMDCITSGLPVRHQLPELAQTHVHPVGDAIQPFHPLSSPSPALNSQHQGLFKWASSSHQVAKVLEFQLQHQSFQWIFRTDFF